MEFTKVRRTTFQLLARTAGIALMIGTMSAVSATAAAHAGEDGGTSFRIVATLGDSAPGGGNFLNDFEIGGLNDRGDALFVSDLNAACLTPSGCYEGVYARTADGIFAISKGGQPAPGGGSIFFVDGKTGINASGQVVVPLSLTSEIGSPEGLNVGLYTKRPSSGLAALLVPGTTPAPSGGTFQGGTNTDINSGGDVVFDAMTQTASGIHVAGEPYVGLGRGVYLASAGGGAISVVTQPGDPAPGGGTLDFASTPTINDQGDIAFRGHVAGHPCVTFVPQSVFINCYDSLYLRRAETGLIQRVGGIGDPAPGGGTFTSIRGPLINGQGQMAFAGSVQPNPTFDTPLGIYLTSPGGRTIPVVTPGDAMPGGGTVQTVRGVGCVAINNSGDVTFEAQLNDGAVGLYVWSRGAVRLVARTGTAVPGFGTLASPASFCDTPRAMNNRGQILFTGTSTDGRVALLVASSR